MKPYAVILLSALIGSVLEGAAFFIGIAFTSIEDSSSLWPFAALYYDAISQGNRAEFSGAQAAEAAGFCAARNFP